MGNFHSDLTQSWGLQESGILTMLTFQFILSEIGDHDKNVDAYEILFFLVDWDAKQGMVITQEFHKIYYYYLKLHGQYPDNPNYIDKL